jgi:hypothetical protein
VRRVDPALKDRQTLPAYYYSNLCRINKARKYFLFLQDARELLFEDIKPLLDIFEIPATRENDLS